MHDFFEGMYAAGRAPWDRGAPRALLVEWARSRAEYVRPAPG
jgi:hypothetical protein